LEAFGLEFGDGLQGMRLVLGLDHEIESGASRGHVEQRAAVEDLQNIRPRSAKNGGDPAEHAGLIGDGEPERNNFSVTLEPAHDNGGEHPWIDIAAAEVEAELAAAKLLWLRQQRGKGGGACTFSDKQAKPDGSLAIKAQCEAEGEDGQSPTEFTVKRSPKNAKKLVITDADGNVMGEVSRCR